MHHSRLGASALKERRTKSGCGSAAGSRTVQPRRRLRYTPCSPADRMSRATRLRPIRTPRPKRSSACTRGAPYVPRDARWISTIDAVGTVYNLYRLQDFNGAYGQAQTGFAIGEQGKGQMWLQNSHGVYLKLHTRRQGLALSLGAGGMVVQLGT